MKCPQCNLDLDYDKKSPQSLLGHIRSQIKGWQRQLDNGSKTKWLKSTLEKWQAWYNWVEKQIESEE